MDFAIDTSLSQPLLDLPEWAAHFKATPIPVLASTALELELLRSREDDVDANMIGEMAAADPLMTLRVLAYASANRPPRVVHDTGTVTAAVLMMGTDQFFSVFGPSETVEERLRDHPQALAGLQAVLRRSRNAARFAIAFAAHRMAPDAGLIHQAAMLHDFAEMLLWCHAPTLALELKRLQQAQPTMRSSVAQRTVLNVRLSELQQALLIAWCLHELLVKTADERRAMCQSSKTVVVAVRLARHSERGWDNPALDDDFSAAADLLNLSIRNTQQLVQDIAV